MRTVLSGLYDIRFKPEIAAPKDRFPCDWTLTLTGPVDR
jgi:hypothetical protein